MKSTRPPMVRLFADDELIVDLFAGGGGASVGIERATGRSPDVAINHDREALSMHRANHPATKHYIENVWRVDPRKVVGANRIGLMWLSPDCKHFSKAKGGQPKRDKKVRSLASVLPYWIKALGPKRRPKVAVLENVEEFQKWGPLLADGTPCPAREGLSFRRFVKQLQNLGYAVDFRELVAADYGAPTTRKRLFLIARCDGKPIVWPKPTHEQHGRYGLPKWRAAAECIDWSIACPSIFERKKALAENTERRIARGIRKFVIDAAEPFIVPVLHAGDARVHAISEPMRTITGAHRGEHAIVTPLLSAFYGVKGAESRCTDVRDPVPTQTGDPRFAMVAPVVARIGQTGGNGDYVNGVDQPVTTVTSKAEHLLLGASLVRTAHADQGKNGSQRWGKGEHSLEDPVPTVPASNDFALMGATLIQTGYGEHSKQKPRVPGLEKPLGTVVGSAAKHGLVTAFMAKHNDGHEATGQDLHGPVHAVTSRDSKALIEAALVMKYKGTGVGSPVGEPLHTVQASGNHYAEVRAFLMKYHRDGGQHGRVQDPMPTLPTHDSVGLVTVQGEQYAIADIGMRMLQPRELFRSHDFPLTYQIERGADGEALTKEVQVRMVGNSVPPPMAEAIIRAQFGLVETMQPDLLGAVA